MSDLMDSTPSLKRPLEEGVIDTTGAVLPQDSSTTQAEKLQNGTPIEVNGHHTDTPDFPQPESKRVKLDNGTESVSVDARKPDARDRQKGVALIKEEYLIKRTAPRKAEEPAATAPTDETKPAVVDDRDRPEEEKKEEKKGKKQKKEKGQNKGRQYGDWADAIRLCNSRANSSEFSPKECSFGDRCNLSHDLRKYLKEGRREDLTTFEGKCPVFEVNGRCHAGWKCRFVGSHSKEIEHDDGRKELILLVDPIKATTAEVDDGENRVGVHNVVSSLDKLNLARRVTKTPKSDQYNEWIEKDAREMDKTYHKKKDDDTETKAEHRATFIDPPFRPSEKRRIYFGPETPVLAPLTTQGNLPFRRLCVDLGAQLTYSEMAMAFPLIQGQKSEWALMKAHESEITPPLYTSKSNYIVQGYDNSKDLKFGAQIAANKPWHALKAAEILSTLVPHLREININCGCPIDLVYRQGAGSALLDTPSKLEKMVRGMNAVSGEVPITVKIRMGTKDDRPTANKLIQRMAFGGDETRDRLGAPGCAAITLHGRSRQQRYTRSANWSYIAECAALVKSFHDKESALTDTAAEPDAQHLANGGKMFLIGNGDCYSHVDYYDHINNAGVDSVMLARGALIKPWLFEEIEKGQYLDKSASERLAYVERFVRYGLEAWGSDEMGISATRRFLLEWLSFAHRYVPIGILEHLPPSLQDRPPAYRGRNELETLLASDNYKDWIKISEMFLGPVGAKFQFQPKHKSNSYETEIEG